jgi:hypothetical protein
LHFKDGNGCTILAFLVTPETRIAVERSDRARRLSISQPEQRTMIAVAAVA